MQEKKTRKKALFFAANERKFDTPSFLLTERCGRETNFSPGRGWNIIISCYYWGFLAVYHIWAWRKKKWEETSKTPWNSPLEKPCLFSGISKPCLYVFWIRGSIIFVLYLYMGTFWPTSCPRQVLTNRRALENATAALIKYWQHYVLLTSAHLTKFGFGFRGFWPW